MGRPFRLIFQVSAFEQVTNSSESVVNMEGEIIPPDVPLPDEDMPSLPAPTAEPTPTPLPSSSETPPASPSPAPSEAEGTSSETMGDRE